MRRWLRRRTMHYTASSLHDGTVLAAYPMRKPAPRIIKRDGLRIDADGVTIEYGGAGEELTHHEGRFRFQDIIANSLNSRRAIRDLVLPPMAELHREITALRAEVAELKDLLSRR